jgi:large subunit ribosomal protein L15
MLTLNTIPAHPGATHSRKRLGRGQGSGRGGTAGKGHKGQLARSGGVSRPGFEGGQTPLYRKLPKRGFNNFARRTIAVLNLQNFETFGSVKEISLENLKKTGNLKGRYDQLIILGTGEVKSAYQVKAHRVSPSAQEKIKKAGGSVEIIEIKEPKGKKKKRNRK